MEDVKLPESYCSIETRQWLGIILGQNGIFFLFSLLYRAIDLDI